MSALLLALALTALQPTWRERASEEWIVSGTDRDGRTMLVLALQRDQWVAFDGQTGAWLGSRRGGSQALDEQTGWPWRVAPVLHPGEPSPRWSLRRGDSSQQAQVRLSGWRLAEDDQAPLLDLTLSFPDGSELAVTERVECWRDEMFRGAQPVVHLDRGWTVTGLAEGDVLEAWLALGPGHATLNGEPWSGWSLLPEDAHERLVNAPVTIARGTGEPSVRGPLVTWVRPLHEPAPAPPPDVAADLQAGFTRLGPEDWRGYRQEQLPDGWREDQGALARLEGAGDIVSRELFGEFELRGAWRIAAGGNSGIFFHGTEEEDAVYMSAPEMQVLDNDGHPGLDPLYSAGGNYGLHAPPRDVTLPVGAFNQFAVRVEGKRVRHWLNGVLSADYLLGSPEWEALVAETKFAAWPTYGRAGRGHLALQDHGAQVWYRDLRVLRLDQD